MYDKYLSQIRDAADNLRAILKDAETFSRTKSINIRFDNSGRVYARVTSESVVVIDPVREAREQTVR